MDDLMIAVIVLLSFTFASRVINERANKKLDQEKKAELIDLFSKDRMYTFAVLISIIILFFASLKFDLLKPFLTFVIYIFSILLFLVSSSIMSYRKLKKAEFPSSYINTYILSTVLRLLGFVIFVALMKI